MFLYFYVFVVVRIGSARSLRGCTETERGVQTADLRCTILFSVCNISPTTVTGYYSIAKCMRKISYISASCQCIELYYICTISSKLIIDTFCFYHLRFQFFLMYIFSCVPELPITILTSLQSSPWNISR